jgi:2,5-diketo-D-gluconate reductase B
MAPSVATMQTAAMDFIEVQGSVLPAIGFGTGGLRGDDGVEGVRHALEIGYRHIDTARRYQNEAEVGEGLRRSGVPRLDVFLTTKIMGSDLAPDRVGPATDASLAALGVDHVDLLLIHVPSEAIPLEATLAAMVDQQEAGRVRHIGVSNFRLAQLRQAMAHTRIFTNQVPYQPGRTQRGLAEMARSEDFLLTAYSPLRGEAINDPVMVAIAEAHGKTVQQVALRWLVQQPGVTPIPRSATPSRRIANFEIFDFELTAEQMASIFALSALPNVEGS